MESNFTELNKDDFTFVQSDKKIYDQKFETKNIGFFKDALIRFTKNKASIVAFVIIIILALFAIIVPAASKYDASFSDTYLKYCSPNANGLFGWDGTATFDSLSNERGLKRYNNYYPLGLVTKTEETIGFDKLPAYKVTYNTYVYRGSYVELNLSKSEYNALIDYQLKENSLVGYDITLDNGVRLIKANTWTRKENEILVPAAQTDTTTGGNVAYSNYYLFNSTGERSSATIDDSTYDTETKLAKLESDIYFATANYITTSGQYVVRVNYCNYFKYVHGFAPSFVLGSNNLGQDLCSRLANGLRFSLILGIIVSAINIAFGIFIGAIEGYYGGAVDMIIERIIEILNSVPTIVVCSLFVFYLGTSTFMDKARILLFVFFISGWTGIASTVRSQFYRYKGQEYVLAARTLGAKDNRIIFRHILPNSVGPLITQGVLYIPSVIFSEASLSYLGIINFNTGPVASVGSLLSSGQSSMLTAPHVLIFPALVVAILMVAFNIFGNGLRDAFNPSLRGAE